MFHTKGAWVWQRRAGGEFCIKMMNCALKVVKFVLKMMNFGDRRCTP